MARRWQNIPCPAGCAGGLIEQPRGVVTTDKDGNRVTATEMVDVPCGACDSSGYIHIPGDDG